MWNAVRRRVAEVVQPGKIARETEEELNFHVRQVEEAHLAMGLSQDEARRRARLELGSVRTAREAIDEERSGFVAEQTWRELRHAARVLIRAPGATLATIVILGLGLGASTTLFALVDAVVLRPLPYPEPHRLVRIFDTNQQAGVDRSGVASGNVFEWRARTPAFAGIAGYYAMGRTLSFDNNATSVIAAQVTSDFFEVGGVRPAVGRVFTSAEFDVATFSSAAMPTGTNPVIVLSDRLWRTRFGADSGIIGQQVLLERRPFTVVGVMPPSFALPGPEVHAWIPWRVDGASPRDQHYLGGIARLAPHVSIDDAQRQLAGVARELGLLFPATNEGWTVQLVPLHEDIVGTSASVLWLLLAAVGLLLVVACANVALMTLTRGLDRAGESAVRLALGASPRRLVREFLMESAIETALAGAAGLVVARMALALLPALAPDLPRLGEARMSLLAYLFAFLAAALVAALAGLPQAWRRARMCPVEALSDASTRTTRRSHTTLRHAAAASQVALAVVLLSGAGLLVRSVQALNAVGSGFDPSSVLVVPVFLDTQAYKDGDMVRTYYRTLFERLSALPTVVGVGGATTVPSSPLGPDFARPVWRPEAADDGAKVPAAVRIVTAGYTRAMGMAIVAGRSIDDSDQAASPRVVLVSRRLAQQLWPGESPIGQQLVVDYSTAGTYPYDVVGVVGDVRFRGPRSVPEPEIYLAHAQRPYLTMNVVLKSSGDPRRLRGDVARVMRDLDPHKPPQGINALDDLLASTYARDRLTMTTFAAFSGTATLLAMLSVYGVLARLVHERRRDIAIRMAMGADGRALWKWVSAAGARLVLTGILAGLVVSALASRALERFLYGIAPYDPLTLGVVVAAVCLVGALATCLPWLRAARIDPLAILRRG